MKRKQKAGADLVLTLDIGNTNINLGLFDDTKITMRARFSTQRDATDDQYAVLLHTLFAMHGVSLGAIAGCVVSSVVPELTTALVEAVRTLTGKAPLVLSPGVRTGLNILIDNPAQLGADLAAGAVGAVQRHPLPAFVVDLGTATKIYVVDENRSFRGCMIAPGMQVSLQALTSVSSLLPAIPLEAPKEACGTNTVESMQSGVVLGTAAMIDGLLDRFAEELGAPKSIVATGGLSKCVYPVCRHEIRHDADLILHGLKTIYDKNN